MKRVEAQQLCVWPCGHPRTPENTQPIGKAGERCRTCRQRITRDSLRRRYRVNYLPKQIEATRIKLIHLEREAERLGVSVSC